MTKTRRTQVERRNASYEALVRSAMHAFHEKGYTRTTVADIVEPTPYSPGAFYHHFRNKADCLWHVVAYREQQRARWEEVAAELDPAHHTLEELVGEVFARFSSAHERADRWVLVMVDVAQHHRDDPEVLDRLHSVYTGWVDEIATFVELLRRHGHVRGDRDPRHLATQLLALGEGLAVHASTYGIDAEAYRSALVDGTVRLLRA